MSVAISLRADQVAWNIARIDHNIGRRVLLELYRQPHIYDLIYRGGTEDQFAALQKIAQAPGVATEGRWLETACGSARLLERAERAGIAVAGFDREEVMVRYGEERLSSSAQLEVADLESFADRFSEVRFPFAFTLVNTIRHLMTDEAVLQHFEEMARVLASQGQYVIGISLLDRARVEIEEDVWVGAAEGIRVSEVAQSLPPESESDRRETILSHVTVERDGEPAEHHDHSFFLRTYTQEEWESLIGDSALKVRETYDLWGDRKPAGGGEYILYALSSR